MDDIIRDAVARVDAAAADLLATNAEKRRARRDAAAAELNFRRKVWRKCVPKIFQSSFKII